VGREGVAISAAVEGIVDRAVVERLAIESGVSVYSFHGMMGKQFLKKRLQAFNNAARFSPWLVLVDLDRCNCAPAFLSKWLIVPSQFMRFRIAVRSVEAWLLADADTLADFLHVRISLVPTNPDMLVDPKESLVSLSRRSTRAEIRKDMVPRPGSGNSVGPAYASRLIEYISDRKNGWRPNVAASMSDSLRRCGDSLQTLIATTQSVGTICKNE
jgi:hypothetical protein